MGQYYYIVNIDKKQFLHPHRFGDGLKLMEFSCSAPGTMTALAVLLADGNGRGGGDLRSARHIIGSWSRDRIVVAGDYADPDLNGHKNLFHIAGDKYEDISDLVIQALCDDPYVAYNFVDPVLRAREGWACADKQESAEHKELLATLRQAAAEAKAADLGEPPHVRLARMVLRCPDDPANWRVLLDACIEVRDNPPLKRGDNS